MITGILKTKHGNRIVLQAKPKDFSRTRFGIIISYSDVYARTTDKLPKFTYNTCIKDLYYQFFDALHYYGKPNGFGYIRSREVLINPVGDLRSRRYFITDNGRKRLEELKKLKNKRKRKRKNV